MEWIQVAQTSEIQPGASKVIRIGDERVAVFNVNGQFRAIDNTCPHQGGPLGEGHLEDDIITCPWHGWKYNIQTGCAIVTPTVKTYELKIDGGMIQVAVDSKQSLDAQPAEVTFERNEETEPVYEILEQINLGKTLDEVFQNIYVALQEIVPHNRLGIALIDESSGRLVQVKTKSDRKILLDDGFSARLAGSTLERVLESGEARIIADFQQVLAERPSPFTQLMVREGMRSNLTLPLRVDGKPIGVVFFTSATPGAFSEAHVGFLKQIASQLSILVEKGRWVSELAAKHDELEETNRLLEEAYDRLEADNARKTEELFTARVIQEGFLPDHFPDLPFLEVAAFQKPATFVGGDYYDFFPIDDEKLAIAIGDATGHGVGSSLMVSATKMALRTITGPDLALKIRQINTHLKQINSYPRLNMALCLFELAYDERSSTVNVRAAGGGMPPLIVVRSNGAVEEILIEGMPLGAMAEVKYGLTEFQLGKSDLLIAMSDGLVERLNEQAEQLGYIRMISEIQRLKKMVKSGAELLEALVQFGDEWSNHTPQDDDVTLVVLKVK